MVLSSSKIDTHNQGLKQCILFNILKYVGQECCHLCVTLMRLPLSFPDCNTLIQFITSGLNYFGYKENQFSAIGWTTTRDKVTELIQTANTQAANINNILKYTATKDVLKGNRDLFSTSMLAPAKQELNETTRRIIFEQSLKKKAIEVITYFK